MELVRWLLAHASRRSEADSLFVQIPDLLVSAQCDCGCPSIEFRVEGLSATASIVAEADGRSPEGTALGVILWARAGRLSGLEIYDLGDATTVTLPRPERLSPSSTISAV
jgi:hypothetical protein